MGAIHLIGLPDVTDASTSQPSTTFAASNSSSGKKSSVGAIVGGVVGTLLGLLVISLVAFFYVRHRKERRGASKNRQGHARPHLDLDAESDDGRPLESPISHEMNMALAGGYGLGASTSTRAMQWFAHSPFNITPFTQGNVPASEQQQEWGPQMRQNLQNAGTRANPVSENPRRQAISSGGQNGSTNVVMGLERSRRPSHENIPSVAEQLDEKHRLRARQATPASAYRPPRSGIHSRRGSVTNSTTDNTTVSVTHAHSQLYANRHGGGTTVTSPSTHTRSRPGFGAVTDAGSSDAASSAPASPPPPGSDTASSPTSGGHGSRRRDSLMKSWRRRRARRVENPGSDSHVLVDWAHAHDRNGNGGSVGAGEAVSVPGDLTAPSTSSVGHSMLLPLNARVAGEGQTTTPSDVVAQIPGARVPNARERELPPPEYSRR